MPFSTEQLDDLQRDLRLALASTTLSAHDRQFLRDMQTKLRQFGREARLSDKQYRRLVALTTSSKSRIKVSGDRRRGARHAGSKSPLRTALGAGLAVLFAVGFLGYSAAERVPEYMGLLVAMTAVGKISGRVTHVRDGDTIEVKGIPLRFGSLDCAESGTAAGERATARMRELVAGQTLTCYLNGRTSYDRRIGSCRLEDGRDLAGQLIAEGYCSRFW